MIQENVIVYEVGGGGGYKRGAGGGNIPQVNHSDLDKWFSFHLPKCGLNIQNK